MQEFDYQLCYIDGVWAYFSDCPVDKVWGDDWDDAPYEHNAGEPYHYRREGDATVPVQIIKVAWVGDLYTPCEGWSDRLNSFSVAQINNGEVPWLRTPIWSSRPLVSIMGGTTLAAFIRQIHEARGEVYLKIEYIPAPRNQ